MVDCCGNPCPGGRKEKLPLFLNLISLCYVKLTESGESVSILTSCTPAVNENIAVAAEEKLTYKVQEK